MSPLHNGVIFGIPALQTVFAEWRLFPYLEEHGSTSHTRAASAACADRHQGRDQPERLAANVVARYLDEEARFLAAVEKGIAAAERGEFIEEEEMDARLDAMFKA